MKNSVVLRRARALIAKGWTQYRYEEVKKLSNGELQVCYCTMGALHQATETTLTKPQFSQCFRLVIKAISQFTRQPDYGVGNWNDMPHRRHGQVLKMFDVAIGLAIKEEKVAA
jgi:hypothetical protein